jgi:hypothetical protein
VELKYWVQQLGFPATLVHRQQGARRIADVFPVYCRRSSPTDFAATARMASKRKAIQPKARQISRIRLDSTSPHHDVVPKLA